MGYTYNRNANREGEVGMRGWGNLELIPTSAVLKRGATAEDGLPRVRAMRWNNLIHTVCIAPNERLATPDANRVHVGSHLPDCRVS